MKIYLAWCRRCCSTSRLGRCARSPSRLRSGCLICPMFRLSPIRLPGYEMGSWQAAFAPGGTPKDVVAKINGEIVRMLQTPDVRERIAREGADPVGSTPDEFAKRLASEMEKVGEGGQGDGDDCELTRGHGRRVKNSRSPEFRPSGRASPSGACRSDRATSPMCLAQAAVARAAVRRDTSCSSVKP